MNSMAIFLLFLNFTFCTVKCGYQESCEKSYGNSNLVTSNVQFKTLSRKILRGGKLCFIRKLRILRHKARQPIKSQETFKEDKSSEMADKDNQIFVNRHCIPFFILLLATLSVLLIMAFAMAYVTLKHCLRRKIRKGQTNEEPPTFLKLEKKDIEDEGSSFNDADNCYSVLGEPNENGFPPTKLRWQPSHV
ncbi:hypothetical protein ACOME3_006289 [Neoechinorhynchus agilis]